MKFRYQYKGEANCDWEMQGLTFEMAGGGQGDKCALIALPERLPVAAGVYFPFSVYKHNLITAEPLSSQIFPRSCVLHCWIYLQFLLERQEQWLREPQNVDVLSLLKHLKFVKIDAVSQRDLLNRTNRNHFIEVIPLSGVKIIWLMVLGM